VNIEEEVENIISSNEEPWKNLNYHKSKVKNRYISNLEQEEPGKDAQQSWRSVSGQFLEIFVYKYIETRTEKSVLFHLELTEEHKEQLKLQFGNERKLPDLDVVICRNDNVETIISCKTSMRERVSQTLFWKKVVEEQTDVRFYFVTTDSDDELSEGRKWRPILETVMDRNFILEENKNKMSENIRPFNEIIEELK
jgi:type II restriction enzyme